MQAATNAGGQALSSTDVCKTQVGNAVVPIPYPNTVQLADAEGFSQKVLLAGGNALTLASSVTSSITGPGPNIIGGVVSSTMNNKCKFTTGSTKVFIEGHPAVRLNDPSMQNKNNCPGMVNSPSQTKVQILS